MPISEIRTSDVGKPIWITIIGKSADFSTSENHFDIPISATKDNIELVSYFHEIYPSESAENSLRKSLEDSLCKGVETSLKPGFVELINRYENQLSKWLCEMHSRLF